MYRILVIEDEEPLREEIVDQLIFADYEVFSAPDGEQGIQLALECKPDAIICDISMPGIDGYEVLQHLRGHDQTRITPFIFLTARTDRPFMRHGMELGANDYLTKPFSRHELLATLATRLKQAHTSREFHFAHLEQLRDQLLHLMSHELKSPLTGMKMASDILDRHLNNLNPNEVQDLVSSVKYGGDRLHHLIQQFTLYFQLESMGSTLNAREGIPASVNSLLLTAINNARRYSFRNSELPIISSPLDEDIMLDCNPVFLKHALIEILVNGINFSHTGEPLSVTVESSESHVWFTVTDRGSGIPTNQIQEAFTAFKQLNREQQEQQGMGLGLYLVDKIMQFHHGTLQFQSTVGVGTQVVMKLPREAGIDQ